MTQVAVTFRTSEPLFVLLGNRSKFGGMEISNHLGQIDEATGMYIESFTLTSEHEWDIPSLLSTLSDEMHYWQDFKEVKSIRELKNLIATVVDGYTSDDMSKCMKWDDFDDYLVLLLMVEKAVRNGEVCPSNLRYFNESYDFDE